MIQESDDHCGGLAAPDLSGFGLDLPDEAWFSRLRRATHAPHLGQLHGYELLEEVSRGAQGMVYRARDAACGRTVAVKRLLAGSFATEASRARFEREMEAVASLQHANIVAVFEGGYADRQPLLVMEWVDGLPVDRWADAHRRGGADIEPLLSLFVKICEAVHHAHQRGVIHRDLKPSNILVDAGGEPHLLDFGLAKLTGHAELDLATLTQTSDFIGTPAYAAPEQVRCDHLAVDVRTDVYALGVILYRMLTGQLPFSSVRNLSDMLHAIQYADATKPSRLNLDLDDDIDAVIGKSTAKEADRRYPSVHALATDISRYLSDEPIEAKRGRRWYMFRKTIKQYRTAACVIAAFFVLLVGATLALSAMYARQARLLAQVISAHDAESRARHAAQQQQHVLENLLAAAAGIGKGTDLTVRRAWLDEATRLVESGLVDDPDAQAAACDAIGRTYQSLALYPEAERHLRSALELRRAQYAGDHPDLATSLIHLGQLLQDCNRFAEAEPPLRDALSMRQRLFTGDHPDVAASLNAVGLVLQYRNDYVGAELLHHEALEMCRRLYGDAHPEVAYTLNQLGNALTNQQEYQGAEALFREALQMYRELFGEEHREVAATKINVAKALFYRADYHAAEPLFREAIETYRQLLGDGHDNVAWGMHRLGVLLHARGEYAEAESTLRESLAIYRRCFGDSDPFVAMVLNSLGTLLLDRGDTEGARPLFDEAMAIQQRTSAPDDPLLTWRLNRIAEWYERTGDFEQAEPLLRDVLEHRDAGPGVEYPFTIRTINSLARLLLAKGAVAEATELYEEALEIRRAKLGDEHPDVAESLVNLGSTLRQLGRLDEAEPMIREGLDLERRTLGSDHPKVARTLIELAFAADSLGDPGQAARLRQEASNLCEHRECPEVHR